MARDIEIDGHSRRFQLAVLVLAVGIVFTALVAVSAISNEPTDVGIGLGSGQASGEPAPGNGSLFGLFGGSNNQTPANSNDEGSGPGSDGFLNNGNPEDGSVSTSDRSGLRDMLNADDSNMSIPEESGENAREDQFSFDSIRSFAGDTHFFARGGQSGPTYWRTGTHGTYTGDGFKNTMTGPPGELPSLDAFNAPSNETQTDTISLQGDASRLPTTGMPIDVSILSGANPDNYAFKRGPDGSVIVTDGNGTVNPLPEGTQFNITTRDDLTATNNDPYVIQTNYTEVPEGLPDRVTERSKDITEVNNAETNEEKAEAITTWLRTNKQYRPDTGHDTDRDAVDEFLFDRGGGNAGHFATTSAVMLRTQGVPARVATGYRETGDSSSVEDVGSMDQHAWVEVFTEDDGWVRYDPTPTTHEQVDEMVRNGNRSAVEHGVHEDVIDAWIRDNPVVVQNGNADSSDSDVFGPSTGPSLGPPYNISVSPDPTPGRDVTVSVRSNGTPVHGIEVAFNDDVIGRTGPDGTIDAQVPYTNSLTVTVNGQQPGESDRATSLSDPQADVRGGALASGSPESESDTNSSETYDIPTNISVGSDQLLRPGEETTTTFTINGAAVPNIDVYVDGERVGETNTDGQLAVVIPADAAGGENITVRAQRGEINSKTTVTVAKPKLKIDGGILAIPGTTADVTLVATDGEREEPLGNQTVTIVDGNGDAVAASQTVTVGPDGTATVKLPMADSITASATVYDVSTSETLGGLFHRLAAVVIGVVLVVGGGLIEVYRRDVRAGSLQQTLYNALFLVAGKLQRAGAAITGFAYQLKRKMFASVRGAWRYVTRLNLTRLKQLPGTVVHRVATWFAGIPVFLKSLPALLAGLFAFADDDGVVSNNPPEAAGGDSGAGDSRAQSAYDRIRSCWRWLVRYVIGRAGRTTKTTVEIGEEAIQAGFPEGPVTRLRRAFQRIEYGFAEPDDHVTDAEDAVETLRSDANGDVEETA